MATKKDEMEVVETVEEPISIEERVSALESDRNALWAIVRRVGDKLKKLWNEDVGIPPGAVALILCALIAIPSIAIAERDVGTAGFNDEQLGTAMFTTDDNGTATLRVDTLVLTNSYTINNQTMNDLTVTGATLVVDATMNDVTITGATTMAETLVVTGDLTANDLTVNDGTITGAVTIAETLGVTGNVSGNDISGNDLSMTGTITGATTLDVDSVTVDAAGAGLDAQAAGKLNIGTTTADAIDIGKTTEIVTILGPLNTDEAVTMDTTLEVTGNATFNVDIIGDAATVVTNMAAFYITDQPAWTGTIDATTVVTVVGGVITVGGI